MVPSPPCGVPYSQTDKWVAKHSDGRLAFISTSAGLPRDLISLYGMATLSGIR